MDTIINEYLRVAPEFDLMPPTNDASEIYVYTAGRKMA